MRYRRWLLFTLSIMIVCLIYLNKNDILNSADNIDELPVLNLAESSGMTTLDSTQASDAPTFTILNNVFEGLYRLGKNNTPVPGVAESYEVTDEGKRYTFELRRDAYWSNGDKIIAQDFEFAWKKALNPNSLSPNAFNLGSIKNAKEIINQGSDIYGQVDKLGVRSIDKHTLEVTLEKPTPHFINLTTFPTFFPQNKDFVNNQNGYYAMDGIDSLVFNGPFVLSKMTDNQGFQLKKNEKYWDRNSVQVGKINFQRSKNMAHAVEMYKRGEIDRTRITAEYLEEFQYSTDFHTVEKPVIHFLRLNQDNEVLKNPNIRKALEIAWDKELMVREVVKGGASPAHYFVPDDFAFNSKGKDFRGNEIGYNNVEELIGKEYWKKGLQEIGTKQVTLELLNYESALTQEVALFIKNQLENYLEGLNIVIDPKPIKEKLRMEDEGDYDISFSGWGPDYQDPMTFLKIFETNHPKNQMNYSNEEYDRLIKLASDEKGDRWEYMKRAEKILLEEDTAIIPMFQKGENYIEQSYVKDIISHPVGGGISYKWAKILTHKKEKDSDK